MKKRNLPLVLASLALVLGCSRHDAQKSSTATSTGDAAQAIVVDEGCPHMENGICQHDQEQLPATPSSGSGEKQSFGKPLGTSPLVSLEKLLANPSEFHDKTVRVEGHVSRACSRKGCWMELAVDATERAARCRVTFENYGFFVPRDSAGSSARLEGRVQVTAVKPEAVKHYESEGAQFPNKGSDGSAQEVRLIATGVELERS